MLRQWWTSRARLLPLVPGGPCDLGTIWGLYRTNRSYGYLRWDALCIAVRIDWRAWRYSRAMQRKGVSDE